MPKSFDFSRFFGFLYYGFFISAEKELKKSIGKFGNESIAGFISESGEVMKIKTKFKKANKKFENREKY